MEISKERLIIAASKLGVPREQIESLWRSLENETPSNSPLSIFFFYFGAMIIVAAMSWFLGLTWEWYSGGAIFLISLLYGLLFVGLGSKLWERADLKILGGLFITLAVCMVPLAIYGVETYFKIWPAREAVMGKDIFYSVRSSWIFMEVGTILAGIIALRFFAFPFITAPIFFAIWLIAVESIPRSLGYVTEGQIEWITLWFGFGIWAIAYYLDSKKMKDYSFWGYFFGTLAFWIGLTSLVWDQGELVLFLYLIVNLLMMVCAIILGRKVLLVFGAFGTFIYFSHLAYEVFKDSILFPLVASLIGLLVIYLGVLYQKNWVSIEKKIMDAVPSWIKTRLP